LSDIVYQQIKEMIISLEFVPGQPLVERELTERFQVGQMPLRDALQRLAMEDLVTIVARQGTFVTTISISDLRSILELRLLLEPFCARLAARRATQEDLAALRRHVAELDPNPDPDTQYKIALSFHRLLSAAAHNPRLGSTLEALQTQNLRFFRYMQLDWPDPRKMQEHHAQIVSAIERRDDEGVAALMRAHVEEACRKLLAAWTPDSIQNS
jgi:DNA-binding GntR family transcriptional regulator